MGRTTLETGNSKLGSPGRPAKKQIKDFTDLNTWSLARDLRKTVYDFTKRFPADEKHVLVAQFRRAAISVTANLAEGFGRYSYRENVQFCRHARGSLHEVRDHLTTALDAGYLSQGEWKQVDDLAQRVAKLLNGYIRSTQNLQKRKDS
ncbi:MAG: four helix bundle protein [Candidatus Acidiferrales bacterium]